MSDNEIKFKFRNLGDGIEERARVSMATRTTNGTS